MSINYIKLFFSIYLFVFSSYSQASLSSLVEADWVKGSGDNKLTIDRRTGLEWLDLTETVNRSVFSILTGYGNWVKNGFRYATGLEVNSLLDTAGFDQSISGAELYADQIPGSIRLETLANMIGKTLNDTPPQFTTYGFIADQRYDLGADQVMYIGFSGIAGQQYGYQYFNGIASC